MDGKRRRRAWPWRSATVDPDGYRHYALPQPGSIREPSTEVVFTLCDEWFVAEADFVRGLMRRVAGGGRDALDYAATTTALAYFQAVRNGNGMAQFVRAHLEGTNPIREPKGLFIRTIELHRSAALREDRSQQATRLREASTAPEDLSRRSTSFPSIEDPIRHPTVDALLSIRDRLAAIAADPAADAEAARAAVTQLESFCDSEIRDQGVLDALTQRQQLVFLLRAHPLADIDGLALEYDQVSAIASTLGLPTSTEALRQSLRAARVRLRTTHSTFLDELRNG